MKKELTQEQKQAKRNQYQREYYAKKRLEKRIDQMFGPRLPAPGSVNTYTPSNNQDENDYYKQVNAVLLETISKLTNLYGNN